MTSFRSLLIAICVVAALTAAACGGDGDAADELTTFTRDDSNISVVAGQQFRVIFGGSPGVGDDWRLTSEPDAAIAELVGSEVNTEEDQGLSGAPATWEFTFEAVSAGDTEIEFFNCYRCAGADQPSAENEEFSDTVTFVVTVTSVVHVSPGSD